MVPLSWRVGSTEPGGRPPAQINGGHTGALQDASAHKIRLIGELHTFIDLTQYSWYVSKPVRSRIKGCERCQVEGSTLFRVVADTSGVWKLLCPTCRQGVEAQPFYRYGGTWKADKRH